MYAKSVSRARRLLATLLMSALLFVGPVVAGTATEALAVGPCRVTGFSLHARVAMATRGISETEVRDSVRIYCHRGVNQGNGTLKYGAGQSGGLYPVVIINNNGNVVTTYWDGSGGGGGWRVDR